MSSSIWTRCAGDSEIRPLRRSPWRVVEAQHQVSTRKLVDSLDEQAWRCIMTAHARAGERAQALRVYQQVVELMQREIESTPDRATEKLAERIERGESV